MKGRPSPYISVCADRNSSRGNEKGLKGQPKRMLEQDVEEEAKEATRKKQRIFWAIVLAKGMQFTTR